MDENNNREEMDEEFVREKGTIDGFGILALFAGIISFLFTFFLTGGVVVGLILAVVAIILATVSIHRIGKTKIARAGRILGIIGIVVVVLYLILLFILLAMGV